MNSLKQLMNVMACVVVVAVVYEQPRLGCNLSV